MWHSSSSVGRRHLGASRAPWLWLEETQLKGIVTQLMFAIPVPLQCQSPVLRGLTAVPMASSLVCWPHRTFLTSWSAGAKQRTPAHHCCHNH
jgi:hypothetical protein